MPWRRHTRSRMFDICIKCDLNAECQQPRSRCAAHAQGCLSPAQWPTCHACHVHAYAEPRNEFTDATCPERRLDTGVTLPSPPTKGSHSPILRSYGRDRKVRPSLSGWTCAHPHSIRHDARLQCTARMYGACTSVAAHAAHHPAHRWAYGGHVRSGRDSCIPRIRETHPFRPASTLCVAEPRRCSAHQGPPSGPTRVLDGRVLDQYNLWTYSEVDTLRTCYFLSTTLDDG